eukprot:COSAG04_NODE_4440_length_2090_cov_2.542441_3_plen_98_part_01
MVSDVELQATYLADGDTVVVHRGAACGVAAAEQPDKPVHDVRAELHFRRARSCGSANKAVRGRQCAALQLRGGCGPARTSETISVSPARPGARTAQAH